MNNTERSENETLCPHCGANAQWFFLDLGKARIEVMCPDCGRYEMTREEFDQAVIDRAELEELDRP